MHSGAPEGAGLLAQPLRLAGVVAACALLTGLFIYRGFPYELLGARIAASVSETTALQVHLRELEPRPQLAGPAVVARGVRIAFPDGTNLRVDRVLLRPAWSTSWLRLRPAFHVELEAEVGRAEGTLILGATPRFSGAFEEVDLAHLPLASLGPGVDLAGRVAAHLELAAGEAGAQGSIALAASEGQLGLPGMPVALPFRTLGADLTLGGETWLEIASLELEGPLVNATASGVVGRAARLADAALDLRVAIAASPALREPLVRAGVRLDPSGSGEIRIVGSPAHPIVR